MAVDGRRRALRRRRRPARLASRRRRSRSGGFVSWDAVLLALRPGRADPGAVGRQCRRARCSIRRPACGTRSSSSTIAELQLALHSSVQRLDRRVLLARARSAVRPGQASATTRGGRAPGAAAVRERARPAGRDPRRVAERRADRRVIPPTTRSGRRSTISGCRSACTSRSAPTRSTDAAVGHRAGAEAADGRRAAADGRRRRVRSLPRRESRVRARRCRVGAALDGVLRHQLRAPQAPGRVRAPGPRRGARPSTCASTRGSPSIRTVRR